MSNEFLDEGLPEPEQARVPSAGMPSGMNQNVGQLTPELLDKIIHNPNEHPEIRAGAKATKEKLFGYREEEPEVEELAVPKKIIPEERGLQPATNPPKMPKVKPAKKSIPKVEKTPIVKQTPSVVPPSLQSINASDKSVMDFIGGMKKSLYNDEVELLTESTKIQLRSMSVEEYKFMTKHLEMFESDMKRIEETTDDSRLKEHRELVLTNALDVSLQRCITNNYPVEELTLFDWLYLLLMLRCVSRPSDSTFIVTYGQGKEAVKKRVTLDAMKLIERIREGKDRFIKNPLGYVELEDGTGLYLMIPTRGDMKYIESEMLRDPEATASILTSACTVKAFVQDDKAHMMNPEQRIKLFNTLEYDTVRDIRKAYGESYSSFFDVVNEFFEEAFGEIEAIEFSDFILYLYDF